MTKSVDRASALKDQADDGGGLRPVYRDFERQACFIGYSQKPRWSVDLKDACDSVLPEFDLVPWYAEEHFDPAKPLREKVAEMIANSCYGVYDLSSWEDEEGRRHQPRNVFIELGMAIALNRPALLLRHSSNNGLPMPECLEGLSLHEFHADESLSRILMNVLPQWIGVPPDESWFQPLCIFGNRECEFRDRHPRARQIGAENLRCHISDGLDVKQPGFSEVERGDVRDGFDEIIGRYHNIECVYLDEMPKPEGYQLLLCSHCQSARSSPFAIYRITPHTPAEVFITIGMSIALEIVYKYKVPKILLVRGEQELPSLLRGYDVVEAASDREVKRKLKTFIPQVLQKIREPIWDPKPLPFTTELVREEDVEEEPAAAQESGETPDAHGTATVPPRLDLFVGREPEIELIVESLTSQDGDPNVLVLGARGRGKTALAIEVAWRVAEQGSFPGGILWADVANYTPAGILTNWIERLGGQASAANRAAATLADDFNKLVGKSRLLIILDGLNPGLNPGLLLPRSRNYSVLALARVLPGPGLTFGKTINLPPLRRGNSIELLRRRLLELTGKAELSEQQANEAAKNGGDIPASLIYIADRIAKESPETYFKRLRTLDKLERDSSSKMGPYRNSCDEV